MLCFFYLLFLLIGVQGITTLEDGVPQSGNSSVGNETFYLFPVGLGHVDISISVSRRYGDPDIYVTTGSNLPTPSHYMWKSIHFGEDLLTIYPTDENWCENCNYTIGVYAASNTSYTIVAATSDRVIQLQQGVPVREDLTQQQYEYFSFNYSNTTEELTFILTPLGNGDPDLFISVNNTRPNRTSYDWSSQRLYGDSITIPHTDPKACQNCTYYVSVYAFTNTTFTIVANLNGTIELQDGIPQSGSVARGAFVYYDFQVHGQVPVTITSTTINGSSALYVSSGDSLPTLTSFEWMLPSYTQLKSLPIPACNASLCSFKIGIYGTENATYHLVAATEGNVSTITLVSGIAHRDTVPAQEWQYYSIKVEQAGQDLTIVATPISGDPDLYVSLTNPRPNATNYDQKASRYGSDVIIYPNATLGTYYIGVNAFSTSTFNILALVARDNCSDSSCVPRLLDGQPQEGTVNMGHYDYYSFDIGSPKSLLTITVTKEYGDPDIYVSVDGAFPNVTHHNWSSTSLQNDSIAIPNPALGHYIIGIYGYQAAGYSLTVSTQGSDVMISLQNGIPIRGQGDLQTYQYYILPVDSVGSGTEDFTVTVTPFSGDPDLYVSVTNSHPSKTNFTWSATAYRGDSVTVPFTDTRFCLCPFYIAVYSFSASTYSLVASYTAVQNLQDGLPQAGNVALHAMKYYKLRIVQPHDDITITVTPRDGNPDLYVSLSNEPTLTNATWKVVDQNYTISSLVIRNDDPNFCRVDNCVYYIGVYGASATNYSIVAVTSVQRIELQDAVPVRSWVNVNSSEYFTFTVPTAGHDVAIILTPLSGDPDLYVSHNITTPNATNAEYVSRAAGADAIAISNSDATTWNIGVYGYQNSTFMITAYILCSDCPPIMMVNGIPQNGILNKDHYQYYRFFLPSTNQSSELTISLTRIVGDPDVYVRNDGQLPNKTFSQWNSSAFGQDMITIDNPAPAVYEIAVFAYATTQYTLMVSTEAAASVLQDGVAVRENLVKDQYEYFQVHVDRTDMDLTVTVTSFNGDPDLFISASNHRPNATSHDYAAQSPREDSITIPSSRLQLGNYWISVRAWTNCTFTIVSSFSNEMHLQDGIPQAGSVSFEATKFYRYTLGTENHTDITFTLTPYNGNAYLYVSHTEPPIRTNASTYQWSSVESTSQVITIFPSDPHWCPEFPCTFYVAAYGVQACNYSITAASSVTTISLQEGVPQRAWVSTGEYEYFIFQLHSPTADLHITVTPLAGDPDLYVSTTNERPNQTNSQWRASAYGPDAIDIDYTDPNYVVGTYYIAVYAWRNTTFTIVATVTEINETGCTDANQCPYNLLQVGIPQVGFLNATGDAEYYEFHVGSQQNITFTVTPRYGDPDIFIRNDDQRPTSSFFQWSGRNYGRDSVTIVSNCTNCRYLIAIEAFSHTMFSIVATTDDINTITLLENGVPLIAHNDQGTYKYFYVIVSDSGKNESLTISATALSGDPDLYVSRTNHHPNRTNFDNASVAYGSDMYILENPAPGTYYVSTYAYQNATYIILATNGPISLVNSEPHSDELDKFQTRMYAILVQDQNQTDLLITLNVESGDPLLYVNNFQNRSYPNSTSYQWTTANATSAQRYVLTIPANSTGTCYNCSYFIQVYANATLTKYSITASYGSKTLRTLSSGLPFSATVARGNYSYFRGIVDRRDVDLTIGVTTFTGDTDLYVSVTDPSPQRDNPNSYQWSSQQNNSRGDIISISHLDSNFQSGMYYIAVYGVQDSQFTVTMSTAAILLAPGTSQIGVLGTSKSAYYFLSLSNATDVTLSLSPFNSTNSTMTYTICLSTNSSIPQPNQTNSDFCVQLQEGRPLTLAPDTCPGECRGYFLGVFGQEAGHRFTIVASTDDKADVLFSEVPFVASVSSGRIKYFTIYVPDASNVTVRLETCSGDANLYVAQDTYGPGPHNARWISEQLNQIDKVEVQDPTLRNIELYIGVLGAAKNASSEYTLTTWLEPLPPSPQPGEEGMIKSIPSQNSISINWPVATSALFSSADLRYRVYWVPEVASQNFVMYSSCGLQKGLMTSGLRMSENLDGAKAPTYVITGLETATAYKIVVVVEDPNGQRGFYDAVYQTTTGEAGGISIKLLLGVGLPVTAVVLALVIYLIVRNRNLTKELEIEMHDVPKAAVRKAVAGPPGTKEEKQTKQYSRLLQEDEDEENYAPPDPSGGLSVN